MDDPTATLTCDLLEPAEWLSDKGAPWAKLANEKPKGETVPYAQLLQGLEGRAGAVAPTA